MLEMLFKLCGMSVFWTGVTLYYGILSTDYTGTVALVLAGVNATAAIITGYVAFREMKNEEARDVRRNRRFTRRRRIRGSTSNTPKPKYTKPTDSQQSNYDSSESEEEYMLGPRPRPRYLYNAPS